MTATPEAAEHGGYSRVTLVGRQARADLVLPSSEPIGALLPEILAVLGERTAGDPRRRSLTTAVGQVLALDSTLIGSGVVDGAILHLVSDDEIPPPPIVTDVTEETAADLDARRGRWSSTGARWVALGIAALAGALAGADASGRWPALDVVVGTLITAAVCWLLGVGAAAVRRRGVGEAIAAAGSSAVVLALVNAAGHAGWTVSDRIGVAIAAAWMPVAVGGFARRSRGPAVGALVAVVLTLGWVGLRHTGLTGSEADALVTVAGVLALGLLPQWAAAYSGLTALDDRRLSGDVVPRRALEASLFSAHSALIWSTAAVAVTVMVTAGTLASAGSQWPSWLAAAAALVLALRSRSFPLTAEVVSTLAAAALVGAALLLSWLRHEPGSLWPMVVCAVVAVAAALVPTLAPPAHTQARLRGLADRVETLAVLAIVPLTVGVFGVFGHLLGVFS